MVGWREKGVLRKRRVNSGTSFIGLKNKLLTKYFYFYFYYFLTERGKISDDLCVYLTNQLAHMKSASHVLSFCIMGQLILQSRLKCSHGAWRFVALKRHMQIFHLRIGRAAKTSPCRLEQRS